MDELSISQAREVKDKFLHQDISPELQQVLGSVGICRVNEAPLAYGLSINIYGAYNPELVLSHFPQRLRDNIRIKTVSEASAS
jgi:hypothetical protein